MRYYSSIAGEMRLTASINAVIGSMTLDTTAGLPVATPYTLVIDVGGAAEEIVTVTGIAGNTVTITRGEDGSTAQIHTLGALVRHQATARDLREPQDHAAASTSVHGVSGSVVGTTSAQTLTGKTMSGASNTFTNLPTTALVDGLITTLKLAALSVTAAKIANDTITAAQIAPGAVTTSEILDATIVTGDLADGAVTSVKIADGTIATADIADGAIATAKIPDGAITRAKLEAALPHGVVGTDLLSASTTGQQSAAFGADLVWSTIELILTVGTWLVQSGAAVYTVDVPDHVAVGLYDQTLSAAIANSTGASASTDTTDRAIRVSCVSMPTVVTVASGTKAVRVLVRRNGSSTVGAGSAGSFPAAWLFARRL